MDGITNQQVVAYIKYRGEVSILCLQRKFHLGYARARRMLRSLIDEKIVVPVVGLHGTAYRCMVHDDKPSGKAAKLAAVGLKHNPCQGCEAYYTRDGLFAGCAIEADGGCDWVKEYDAALANAKAREK